MPLGCFGFGCFRCVGSGFLGPCEEINLLGNDLAALIILAIFVGPFGIMDTACRCHGPSPLSSIGRKWL
jgi:hypothetical protein